MKKFLALICMITCIFGLTACGSDEALNQYEQQKVEYAKQLAAQSVVPFLAENDAEVFGTYKHMGGKIGTVVVVNGASEEVAKDVAMQACAMNPTALNRDGVPADVVEREKTVLKEQAMNEGKPADIAEKMVIGRINKFYKEICLTLQPFIKDGDIDVETYVKNNNGEVVDVIRYEVGEGMEKRNDNFAEEVMNQVNGN